MKDVSLKGKVFEPFLSSADLQLRISELADYMNEDYAGREVILLGVMDGALLFLADLMRKLSCSFHVHTVKLKSYEGQHSTGTVQKQIDSSVKVTGKHVIVVEDIVDTGLTMGFLREWLKGQEAASVQVASLLVKEDVFQNKFEIKYKGFSIPNRFVVGYGMDYDGYGRGLGGVYVLKH